MHAFGLFLIFAALIIIFAVMSRIFRRRQFAFIEGYQFHQAVHDRFAEKHPALSSEQIELVFQALKDYFWMCNKGEGEMIAMPSKVVDDAWHEFLLFTRNYGAFCIEALGRFLHHTPVEAMESPTIAQASIRRAWRLACEKAGIDPLKPDRLPLIFGIDALFNIAGGFAYVLNCEGADSQIEQSKYCASHIGCASRSGGSPSGTTCGGGGCGGGCGGG